VSIHSLAVVSPSAKLAADIQIGPFAVIEDDVQIGSGCKIGAHTVIKNGTRIGNDNEIAEHVVLGGDPQHLKKGGELGHLIIGSNNVIREYSNFHRAMHAGAATVIGSHGLFMGGTHVAHDCHFGDHIITANNALFAGHVIVEDRAFISGGVGIHQHCRIGKLAMLGGHAKVVQDVPPFVTIETAGCVVGLNLVGLRRAGYSTDQIAELKKAYRAIYRRSLSWSEMLEQLRSQFVEGPAAEFHRFLSGGKRGFCQERRMPPHATLKIRGTDSESDSSSTVAPINASDLDKKAKVG
jgi:UDP-N-acetylglucosamine acyltransferase